MTKTQQAQLAKLFLFSGTKDPAFSAVLSDERLGVCTYAAGETISTADCFIAAIYVVLSGSVLVSTAGSGQKNVPLRVIGRGESFGAASLFGAQQYPTEVRAKTAVTLCVLSGDMVEDYIKTYPRVALRYIGFLSDRIRFLNRKINSFTAGSAEAKLAAYLLANADTSRVSMTNLADALDIGRASLYRALERFSSAGMISKNGRELQVKNRAALESVAKAK